MACAASADSASRGTNLFDDSDDLDAAADALRGRVEALLSPTPVPRDELIRALNAPAPPSSPLW